jgi:hypothetical protein
LLGGFVATGLLGWTFGCSGSRSATYEIEAGRDRWLANRPLKYRYEIEIAGFRPANRYQVEVDVLAERSTVTLLEGFEPGETSEWDSIDALFATAIRVRNAGGMASVEYDETGITPSVVRTDPIPEAVDDETDYRVFAFEVM